MIHTAEEMRETFRKRTIQLEFGVLMESRKSQEQSFSTGSCVMAGKQGGTRRTGKMEELWGEHTGGKYGKHTHKNAQGAPGKEG